MSGWTCPLGLLPWAKATAANSQFPSSKCTGRGHGRRSPPPEPSQNPRGPLQAGLSPKHDLIPRCAGHRKLHPQERCLQPKAWQKGREREHQQDNSAPVVKAPSPACQSLPWPKSSLRDQPARGRTTGKPVPPAGFGPDLSDLARTHPVMSARL